MRLFLPLIHGLCAFFRLLLTPLSTAPSPRPSQFTVCTSRFARLRSYVQQASVNWCENPPANLARNYHITWCQRCLLWRLKTLRAVIISGVFLGILAEEDRIMCWIPPADLIFFKPLTEVCSGSCPCKLALLPIPLHHCNLLLCPRQLLGLHQTLRRLPHEERLCEQQAVLYQGLAAGGSARAVSCHLACVWPLLTVVPRHHSKKPTIDTIDNSHLQRRTKRTQPPPKENLLENFSGLEDKLSRPVVDTKTLEKPGKPYPPPKSFLCGPHFFCKEKYCTGAGRCMLSFSQRLARQTVSCLCICFLWGAMVRTIPWEVVTEWTFCRFFGCEFLKTNRRQNMHQEVRTTSPYCQKQKHTKIHSARPWPGKTEVVTIDCGPGDGFFVWSRCE